MFDKTVLSERVAEQMKQMIKEKNYQPGDKLPNEIEMTKILNIGRSTIREAIKILVSTNILEVRRGRGTFVSENPGIVKDPLGTSFMEEEDLLIHFFETRLILEPQMAFLAAERGSDSEIKAIKKAYEKVEQAILNGENHTEFDIAFHNQIASCTHNPIIKRIVPIINDGIRQGVEHTKNVVESKDKLITQHQYIMGAIENHNPAAAKDAMEMHLRYGLKTFLEEKEK